MNQHFLVKFASVILVFCFLAFTGWIMSERTAPDAIKVVGNSYASEETITVKVGGMVKSEGEYTVAKGTTVHDVIYLAGGITDGGDPRSVSLDKVLTESCSVVVGVKHAEDDAKEVDVLLRQDGKCNINKAPLAQLANLPGVGETIARRIISYRDANGDFESIEDIKNVKGIGQSKYDAIKDFITVGGK